MNYKLEESMEEGFTLYEEDIDTLIDDVLMFAIVDKVPRREIHERVLRQLETVRKENKKSLEEAIRGLNAKD